MEIYNLLTLLVILFLMIFAVYLFIKLFKSNVRKGEIMYVYEIIKPGTWIDSEDRDWARNIEGILRNLESQFFEANLALNMFLNTISHDKSNMSRGQWETDSNRKAEIKKEIESKFINPHDHNNWDEIHLQTEITFKREQWKAGRIPREFQHNQAFMHARAFLYALDSFDKFLNVLKKTENVPAKIEEVHKKLGNNFSDLRGVRNTSQHMEDRSRGLGAGRNPKPLELKPVDNQLVKANGGALLLNCLNGTKFGNTMSDGHYGEVDVSPQSMELVSSIFQEVLDSFQWKGSKSHLPSL